MGVGLLFTLKNLEIEKLLIVTREQATFTVFLAVVTSVPRTIKLLVVTEKVRRTKD